MTRRNNEGEDTVENPYRRAIIKTLSNPRLSKEEKYAKAYNSICAHVLENVGIRGTKKSELLETIEVKRSMASLQPSETGEKLINLEILEKVYKAGLFDLKYSIKRSKSVEIKKYEKNERERY